MNLLLLYAKFCSFFSTQNNLFMRKEKNRSIYEDLILKDFNLNFSQIYLGSRMLSLILSFIIIFFTYIFNLHISFFLFSLLFFFILKKYFFEAFNRYYYKKSQKIESILPLLRSNLELFISFLPQNYDLGIFSIKFLSNIPSPINEDFNKISKMIQNGYNPERLLRNYITPSKSLKNFINSLLISNFKLNLIKMNSNESIEDKFTQFSRSTENRISIIFFIGIFFPIGLGFIYILQNINGVVILTSLLIFFVLIKIMSEHFTKDNGLFLGISLYESKELRDEYNIFLDFIVTLSSYLIDLNPEQAIIKAFSDSSIRFNEELSLLIQKLRVYNISLENFLDEFSFKIEGKRTKIIFHSLKIMILEESYKTSDQLKKILNILRYHQDIERERENIVKGESFRAKLFQILLPIVVGMFSGIFPIFNEISSSFNFIVISEDFYANQSFNLFNNGIFIFSQYLMVLVSSYYFNRIVGNQHNKSSFFIISFIFYLSYFLSYLFIIEISFNLIY